MEDFNQFKERGWEQMSQKLDIEMPIDDKKDNKIIFVYVASILLLFGYLGYQIQSLKNQNAELSNEVIKNKYAATHDYIKNQLNNDLPKIDVVENVTSKNTLRTLNPSFLNNKVASNSKNKFLPSDKSAYFGGNEDSNILNNKLQIQNANSILVENKEEVIEVTNRLHTEVVPLLPGIRLGKLDYQIKSNITKSLIVFAEKNNTSYSISSNYLSSFERYSGYNVAFEIQKSLSQKLKASLGFNFTTLNYQGSSNITNADINALKVSETPRLTNSNKYIGLNLDLNYYISSKVYVKGGLLLGVKTNHQDSYVEENITKDSSITSFGPNTSSKVITPGTESPLVQYGGKVGLGVDLNKHFSIQSSYQHYFSIHIDDNKYRLINLGLKYTF